MNSILNFPERGNYGNASYRGNCSGYVQKELIEHFKPTLFIDVCEGSGTSADVCKELNVDYIGLDLHKGFDFTRNAVLNFTKKQADLVFSHPPYHNMIDYKTERLKHNLVSTGNDLSSCSSVEEFLELSQLMLLNQRDAARKNGIYTTLIGDYRKSGEFFSFQSDFIKMMPKDELLSVAIKLQHNTMSSFKNYNGSFIPINHEYLIIWKKKEADVFSFIETKIAEIKRTYNDSWKNIVKLALMKLDNKARLNDIYSMVMVLAPEKIKVNNHYQAKIRQVLQVNFTPVERGVWALN